MHFHRTPLALALISAIAVSLPGLVASPAGAADQLILGKTFLVKDPKPGVDPTKRQLLAFGNEASSPNTLIGNPLLNGATVEFIANGIVSTSQTFPMPAGAFTPGSWGWKALGNPVFGYLYKDPAGVNGPVKIAFIKKVPSGTFLVKVLVKATVSPINVLPPAAGSDGGIRFTITGGDTYCLNFGGPAGGLLTNAPMNSIANKLFKVVSTATAQTSEAGGCPVLSAPMGGVKLKGALPPTVGRFNYNLTVGLPGANAACASLFGGTHACEYSELQTAETAGDLVGLLDTNSNPVTSFWAIDSTADALTAQCHDDVAFPCLMGVCPPNHTWEYGTLHTASRGQRVPLNNGTGALGALVTGQQCNISGSSAVGCCIP